MPLIPLETSSKKHDVGVVVIGRNEGMRLVRCLDSVLGLTSGIVYVDSASTDGSVAESKAKGIDVVELDMSIPFSAARARNEGFVRLKGLMPTVEFVQFIDGDCELASGWLHKAASFLATNPRLAIVSGRLRERFPDRSVYNMLCDIEWDAPAGEARYCGGVAMTRASAFEATGGYSADLIAGEEPELCVRLRASGWGIWRLEDEMALHDAAMLRFEQWWRRAIRGGHAFAQAASMHGRPPELMGVRESRSAWFWAACVPLLILLCCSALGPRSLWFALLYPAQVVRLALRGKRSPRENWLHAFFLVLGKFPEVIGQVVFRWRHLQGGSHGLIEHK